ncbi:MAG TPA: nicotinate-nucleotide--dimethylbenzimidazole phosphoribosyltransferase [Steroidobacteraceae bacterium]|jgi:nicotinate-nucleotide--dimethylbenzimidazole phosphoribosyltransferase|nr:nicotinate-nucleotide--dimethylbenzimidazole phosphoribosyltransferase [Steroidobacteraceae bacterium]
MSSKLAWLDEEPKPLNSQATAAARARQGELTKPPGALGDLETLAISFAGWQGRVQPSIERVHISVFAADHGVTEEGVSAFPAAVTAEMIRNFVRGGAAISVLARALNATLEVINLGTVGQAVIAGAHDVALGPGTANFVNGPAMTDAQLDGALEAGRQSAERALAGGAQLYIGGDMGIGNTTAAAALACALLSARPEALAGPGTGLDERGVARKATVIRRALDKHSGHLQTPRDALQRLGGFEVAALVGAYLRCAQLGLPALIDGFIAGAAALTASRMRAGAKGWWLFAHRSKEPGHAAILTALEARPLLDLGLRLGEGSGAAVAVPLLRLACQLHAGMATFAEAGVSGKL